MKFFLIVLFALCLHKTSPLLAQQTSEDEAKSLLEKSLYNKKRGNFEGAIGHALLGLDVAESIKDKELIIAFKEVIGQIYFAKKDYEKAIFSFTNIVFLAEGEKDYVSSGMAHLALGDVFTKMEAYNEAANSYKLSHENYQKAGLKREKANAILQLGINYSNANEFSKANEAYGQLLQIAISQNLYSYIGTAQKQLFLTNIKTGDHQKAVKYGQAYYDKVKGKGNKAVLSEVTRDVAIQFLALGDDVNALIFANRSIEADKRNTKSLVVLGQVQAASGEYAKAIKTYESANVLNEQKRNNLGIAKTYNLMAQVAYDNNDERSSLNYLQRAEKIGIEKNARASLVDTYGLMALIFTEKGKTADQLKYQSLQDAVKMQILDPESLDSKISSSKEEVASRYSQNARAKISNKENKKLAEEKEKLKAQQKLQDIEIIEQQGQLQAQELRQKELQAERAQQELLIAKQAHDVVSQQSQLEKLELDAEIQKLSEKEKAKALELLEKESQILIQQTDLQAQKIESDKQAQLMLSIVIGSVLLILVILAVAFYRTYNNGKIIREQNNNLAEQQKTILNRNIQLKKSSEAMLGMNNKLKKAHVNLKILLKKEQDTKEQLEQANTDIKNTQVHLVQAEKMSSLGLLTAGIAHEINNPINFVSSGVQSLTNNFDEIDNFLSNYQKVLSLDSLEEIKKYEAILMEDEDVLTELQGSSKELLDDVRYGIQRITEIVDGLRSFSRHDEAEAKETDINESFESALLILKNKYKDKVEIIRELDMSMPEVQCFPGQLNQVFVNLINNAIDAIDDVENNGAITIKTLNESEEKIKITISDNGSGMPKEVREKIFDPFFTTKEIGKGTGLGLSITHGIIEKHRGSIVVESEEGKGTSFIIELPKKLEVDDKILEEDKLKLI